MSIRKKIIFLFFFTALLFQLSSCLKNKKEDNENASSNVTPTERDVIEENEDENHENEDENHENEDENHENEDENHENEDENHENEDEDSSKNSVEKLIKEKSIRMEVKAKVQKNDSNSFDVYVNCYMGESYDKIFINSEFAKRWKRDKPLYSLYLSYYPKNPEPHEEKGYPLHHLSLNAFNKEMKGASYSDEKKKIIFHGAGGTIFKKEDMNIPKKPIESYFSNEEREFFYKLGKKIIVWFLQKDHSQIPKIKPEMMMVLTYAAGQSADKSIDSEKLKMYYEENYGFESCGSSNSKNCLKARVKDILKKAQEK